MKKWLLFLNVILTLIVPVVDIFKLIEISLWAKIVPLIVFGLNISFLCAGIYVWGQGVKHARFYVIGWLFILSGIIVYLLVTVGVIPYHRYLDFTLYFGSASEAVLFAFAIGDQMNQLASQKKKLELQYVANTLEKNRLLAKQLFMNSHMLRAPISRTLGLINLLRPYNTANEPNSLMDHLETSTNELDEMTKMMSKLLEKEGYLDQYQTDFEEVKQDLLDDLNSDTENEKA